MEEQKEQLRRLGYKAELEDIRFVVQAFKEEPPKSIYQLEKMKLKRGVGSRPTLRRIRKDTTAGEMDFLDDPPTEEVLTTALSDGGAQPWDPDDATVIRKVLGVVVKRSHGQKFEFSPEEEEQVLRIARSVPPDMPPCIIWLLASRYQEVVDFDARGLEIFLAMKPWESPEAWNDYMTLADSIIPQVPLWLLEHTATESPWRPYCRPGRHGNMTRIFNN